MRRSGRNGASLFGHCRLDLGSAAQHVEDAGEFYKHAVAVVLTTRPAMDPDCLEPAGSPFLVGLDEARIIGNIDREVHRESTFDAAGLARSMPPPR
jgi:hypothetical protein